MSGKDILDLLNKFYYLENIMKPHIKVKNHRCNTNRMIEWYFGDIYSSEEMDQFYFCGDWCRLKLLLNDNLFYFLSSEASI
jgi:hypothetical protein